VAGLPLLTSAGVCAAPVLGRRRPGASVRARWRCASLPVGLNRGAGDYRS